MLILLSIFVLLTAHAQTPETLQKVDQLIVSGKIDEALKIAESDESKDSFELLIRRSRLQVLKGDEQSDSKKEVKLSLYEQALQLANKAIETKSDSPLGYLRRGVANGKIALFKGVLDAKNLVNQTREDATKAIALSEQSQDKYPLALAHYLLGRAHHKVSETPKLVRLPLGLGWANRSDALKHLKSAHENAKTSIPFAVDYAKILIEEGQKAAAKELINQVKKMAITDPGDKLKLKEADELAF